MPPPPSAAIYYLPDGYQTEKRADLKGRHVAGAGFLNGVAKHHAVEPLVCYTSNRNFALDFANKVKAAAGRPRSVRMVALDAVHELGNPGCLFLPGPGVGKHAWRRRFTDQRTYSLCGVNHTLCTTSTMDDIGDFLIAPVQSWDALVCTSVASKTVILDVLEMWSAYLKERLSVAPPVSLQLPIIPLGVDCDALAPSAQSAAMRQRFRAEFGIGEGDIAILFAGRLSMTSKVHPVAMWMGAEIAAKRLPMKLHMVMAGWFEGQGQEQEFRSAAARYCPSVSFIHVDGINHPVYRPTWAAADIWTAADIFVSLSDNIQESFGLTPIEAMATGLPSVVSDWDGYKDTVVDGETGFRVPTTAPPPGAGEELTRRWTTEQDSYGRYAGAVALSTAVDLEAYAGALVGLATDAGLRARMSAASIARARRLFDWSAVVRQYEALWGELAARRSGDAVIAPRREKDQAHPLRADPFALFASFASSTFGGAWRLHCPHRDPEQALAHVTASRLNTYAVDTLLPGEALRRMLADAAAGDATVQALLDPLPAGQHERALRSIGWLLKLGLLVARNDEVHGD